MNFAAQLHSVTFVYEFTVPQKDFCSVIMLEGNCPANKIS